MCIWTIRLKKTNASAFGMFFKKQVGLSPINYREKEKGGEPHNNNLSEVV